MRQKREGERNNKKMRWKKLRISTTEDKIIEKITKQRSNKKERERERERERQRGGVRNCIFYYNT